MSNKKSHLGRNSAIIAGALGIIMFFSNGSLNLGGISGGEVESSSPPQPTETHAEASSEQVLSIEGDVLTLGEDVIAVDELESKFSTGERVILRSDTAKQLTYDKVEEMLNKIGVVIIEE